MALGDAPSIGAVVAMVISGLVLVSGRWTQLGAGLAALATATVWVPVVLEAGAGGASALVAAVMLLGLRRSTLPQAVPWAVLGVGLVLAARAHLTGGTFSMASALAAPLVVVAIVVAGAAARPAAGRGGGAALIAFAAVGLVRVAVVPSEAPEPPPADQRRALARSLFALSQRPQDHPTALALSEAHGVALPLNAGWVPAGADLSVEQRIATAWWLHGHSRGGEGRRLLSAARRDSSVAWTWLLFRRLEGLEDPEGFDLDTLVVPGSVPELPGLIPLNWTFYANGIQAIEVHLRSPLVPVLQTRGESWQGPTRLQVIVDGAPPVMLVVPEGVGQVPLPRPLRAGPHRLSVAFTEDIQGEGGDRNAEVHALLGPAPAPATTPDPIPAPAPSPDGAPPVE